MRPVDVTDWAAAKAIWEAVKESGLDLQDDVVVFLGIGPDGSLDVMVQPVDDMEEGFEEEIEFLKARVRQLEMSLHPANESYISPHLKVLPSE